MATVRVGLNARDLAALERELREMAADTSAVDREAAVRLCEEVGLPAAMAACKSTTVAASIHVERTARGAALVADGERASYEEFGTGIIGTRKAPHPIDAQAMAASNYVVDGMGHGEYGWNYLHEDGTFHWTKGRRGSAFMAMAAEAMRREGADVALTELANANRRHFRDIQPGPGPTTRE